MKATIYIIGAGAIGKALAVCLQLHNREVQLVRASARNEEAPTQRLQLLMEPHNPPAAVVAVRSLDDFTQFDGLVVLTNKSYGNPQLAAALTGKTGHSPIVILQNGLGVEEPFSNAHFTAVYRCVLFATSQVTAQNEVRFKPVAVSPIGTVKGNGEQLNAIVDALHTPLFAFRAEPDIQPVIWKKAIINSVFNSICPLLEVDNGIFHRNSEAFDMARRVIAECVAIAREKNIRLDVDEVTEGLLMISKMSDGQLISTLQDIRNKRETEIDTLNFALVRMAETVNKAHLLQQTRLLGELTRLKAALAR